MATKESVRKWYHWYAPEDTPEERRLILKLDLLIVPYAFVLYWVKYMDQTNISKTLPNACIYILNLTRQCICFRNEGGPRLRWQ